MKRYNEYLNNQISVMIQIGTTYDNDTQYEEQP